MIAFSRARRQATVLAAVGFSCCAVAGLGASPAAASDPDPAVWIGSPVASSTWPAADGCGVGDDYNCSLPSEHHIVYANPDIDGGGALDDFAMDVQSVAADTPVVLYAAPQDGSTPVTARVQQVNPACASGDPSLGGYAVSVALYANGAEVGTVTYAHINPTVSAGQDIDRWGTQLGTVGNYTAGSCWTGVHVHTEMSSQHNYACYNGTFAPGQAMEATNFIGFIGGSYASGQRQACP